MQPIPLAACISQETEPGINDLLASTPPFPGD